MRVLLTLENFSYLSGSPLYSFELFRGFREAGHEVDIHSGAIGGELETKAREIGVKFGIDGEYDLWISSQAFSASFKVDAKKHFHIYHSEFDCENADVRADKYFVVRPLSLRKYPNAEILWNPIDPSRFNEKNTADKRFILFVGTVDGMRRQAFEETCRIAKAKGLSVKLVGKKFNDWGILPDNATYEPDRWNIEELTKRCTETAGIMYGRTTIEGFMCGKPGHFWEVDHAGNLLACNYIQAYNVDVTQHFTENVIKKICCLI